MKYICRLKIVPSDELDSEPNLICKIGLKHLIPVSNCFTRRETLVAMQVFLKIRWQFLNLDLTPYLGLTIYQVFMKSTHSKSRGIKKFPKHNIPRRLLTCFSVEFHLQSAVGKEVFSDFSVT